MSTLAVKASLRLYIAYAVLSELSQLVNVISTIFHVQAHLYIPDFLRTEIKSLFC